MLYIIGFFTLFFTKELFVINAELVIIVGFFTIFLLLKRLTQDLLVEAFASYADNIRKTYLSALFNELKQADTEVQNNSLLIQLRSNIDLYYQYLLAVSVLFLNKIETANYVGTVESINLAVNRIMLNIKQMKRTAFTKSITD